MSAFKNKLTDKLIDKICPIGERAMNLCLNEEERLLEIIDQGARSAEKDAQETMVKIKRQVGLLRRYVDQD